jgi:hypothetical protein
MAHVKIFIKDTGQLIGALFSGARKPGTEART